jgi:hypothetical protein
MFLGLTLKSKAKFNTMRAFCCLGQIFTAQGDNETALTLFTMALDEFTFMDVHRWRADCMVRMADIWEQRGDLMKSVELWQKARPLFERSSQAKDVTRIDVKLASVGLEVLEQYKRQQLLLAELTTPAAHSEEADEEESEDEEKVQDTPTPVSA